MTDADAPDALARLTPPEPARRANARELHGETRADDYAWMRDDNWREVMRDPSLLREDIRKHLNAENAYLNDWMSDVEGLKNTLFEEMKARIKEDDSSVPTPDGPFAYFTRHRSGGQYPLFARKRFDRDAMAAAGDEQILFDGDAEAGDASYFDLGGVDHSPDHAILAYALDRAGSEFYDIRFRDLASGEDLPDVLANTAGAFVWANDSRTVFWVKRDENNRPAEVFRHVLGTPADDDVLVYHENDPGYFVSVGKTESDRFIVIDAHNHTTSELRLIDADRPASASILVADRDPGVEYDISDRGDRFFILTNVDAAIDFKVMTSPIDAPGRDHWRDWIGHRDGVLILGQSLFSGHHVRLERVDGLPRIVVRNLETDDDREIRFDEDAYSLGLGGVLEFDTPVMRIAYASPTTPDQLFDYDMNTRERRLLKTREVPSGHTPEDYVARRILAPAADGEMVPVTILHHTKTPIDGSAPLLLYGYGSYGISIPAGFSTGRLSLVDRGFVFAIAHVRGGMEKGYRWYTDGKREKKVNTFTDFIAAGEALVAQGYTTPGKIIAMGGSAGGLLVAAAVNLAPQLFSGIVAAVPFVDVITTMSDSELPLTPPEWPEWGNPIKDADAYKTMAAYSPIDNVAPVSYPPILATAGLTDPRVTYWEPAKWIATLRATATGGGPMLLKTNMDAGHAGATGRWDALKETAFEFAFALKVAGLAKQEPFERRSA